MSTPGEPAAQRAYVATKDLILSGELAGGVLLSENEIAERLGLSRTPVREAFLRLESEQLLHLIPKRGAVVVPVPPTEAADILDLRLALETGAMRRLTDPDRDLTALLATMFATMLATMTELIGTQVKCAEDGDVVGFAEVDELFHRSVVEAAGNALATRCYTGLADRQRRMTIGAVGAQPSKLPALVAQHRSLLGLVRARDLPGFELALGKHLDSTHRALHAR